MAVNIKSNLVTVLRVENQEGLGPFHAEEQVKTVLRSCGYKKYGSKAGYPRPTMKRDPKLREIYTDIVLDGDHKKWMSGFTDPSLFDFWFGDTAIRRIFQEHNFSLQKYLIEPSFVHEGTNQCMFWRPAALRFFDS